jgi:signal peptidase II
MNRFFKMLVMIATIIIVDQVTKALIQDKFTLGESIPLIKNFFHLTYVRNPGAAWGMFGTSSDLIRIPLFFILPVVACFWLIYAAFSSRNTNLLLCLAYSLIFSGAVGNLIDRFSMNYVVDFLDFFYSSYHFPAFNVADSSITIGAGFLIIEFFYFENKRVKT